MANIAENLRPAGCLERWSTRRHSLGFYVNVGMTARYVNTNGQTLTRAVLFRTLESLISKHASLGLTVLDEDTAKPYFARLKEINLDEVTSFVQLSGDSDDEEQREIDQILSTQHRKPFQELGRLPLWRILVVKPKEHDEMRGVDIVFIFHHGIGDGGSGEAFHISFLKALDSSHPSGQNEEINNIIRPPAIPLLSALEDIVPMSSSYKFLINQLWTRLWFPASHPPNVWCCAPIQLSPDGLKTSIQTLVFSAKTVQTLLSACRKEKTTITALLQVLIAKSFFSILPTGPENSVTEISSAVAINLRRFMPDYVTDETMGVFVSSTGIKQTRTDLTNLSIWELARSYRAHLEERIKSGTQDTNTGLLKYVTDYAPFLKSKIGTRRDESFGISNLGVFKGLPGKNGWNIPSRMTFSQSASVTGCGVEFSVSSVKGGDMSICVCYQEGVVEKEFMESFVDVFKRDVEVLVAGILST